MRALPGHVRQRVRRLVEALADNPFPPPAKALRGFAGIYRIPLLDWRIIYEVDQGEKLVRVLRVRRKTGPETYEGIE